MKTTETAEPQARTHTRFSHRLTTMGRMRRTPMTMMVIRMDDREMKAAETQAINTHTLQTSTDDSGEDDDDDDGNNGRQRNEDH